MSVSLEMVVAANIVALRNPLIPIVSPTSET